MKAGFAVVVAVPVAEVVIEVGKRFDW